MTKLLMIRRLFTWITFPMTAIFLLGCAGNNSTTTLPSMEIETIISSPSSTYTQALTQTPYVITAPPISIGGPQQYLIVSMYENGYAHIFAYSVHEMRYTRLTADPWDDITPSLSPDGNQVAFASRRNGYWDLYLLDLPTGISSRLTDTMDYEASPSWSPDGQWLVFETYHNGNLDLEILSIANPEQRQILTDGQSADHSPSWSPLGRQIAFVSDQTGENEIWIADLDKIEEMRFSNTSKNIFASESHPTWSPDGKFIAWAATPSNSSINGIYIKDSQQKNASNWLGSGDKPRWSPDGSQIYSQITSSNENYLAGYNLSGNITLQPFLLPGSMKGFDIGFANLSSPLANSILQASKFSPTPLFVSITTPIPDGSGNRLNLVNLPDVQAPYARILDLLDESYSALRQRIINESGWDALATLDNAFVPISIPLNPGFGNDWLYTGRAFSLNSILLEAEWIVIVKEEIEQQTYWRVYLRTSAQDGSQGEPLHQLPWDIEARFSGTPMAYDQGGQPVSRIPAGFWVDITTLAREYGWSRLPSLSNWRSYFNGTKFGEFVVTSGLDWHSAMLQVYPPEVFLTPTLVMPPLKTPTRTPWQYKTPTPTLTLTPRPSYTPRP